LGVILIHAGLVMLLLGEFFTSKFAVESQLRLRNGESKNYTEDVHRNEFAVIDTSPSDRDDVVVVPGSLLKSGKEIHDQRLPFDIKVKQYYPNSILIRDDGTMSNPSSAGAGRQFVAVNQPEFNGLESRVDAPSAYLALSSKGRDLGTFLISQSGYASPTPGDPDRHLVLTPQSVEVDGKSYQIGLRPHRYYKPWTITLKEFVHSRYEGTDIPKDFASIVHLSDPNNNEDRDVRIWMNHPLRYNGETLYQSSFDPDDQGTVLQVVDNPSWTVPYIACTVTAIGLLLHFVLVLINFLGKRSAADAKAAMARLQSRPRGREDAYTLDPKPWWARGSTMLALGAAAVAVIYLASALFQSTDRPLTRADEFNLEPMSRFPISYNGRIKPLDTLARVKLQLLSTRETFRPDGKTVRPAILWLIETMTADAQREGKNANPPAFDYKVFRIDDMDVKNFLGLDPEEHIFSLNQIMKKDPRGLLGQIDRAAKVPEQKRDRYQSRLVQLGQKFDTFQHLDDLPSFYLIPPAKPGQEWKQLAEVVQESREGKGTNKGLELWRGMLSAYINGQPSEFNQAVAAYESYLQQVVPDDVTRVNTEVYFNRFDPFVKCIVFYLFIFILIVISWLCVAVSASSAAQGLRRVAFALLLVTLLLHTGGLIGRIYISGRPPVTNLASAAIFIAWGAAILAAGLETIFKNSIGAAAAALIGCGSLFLAHRLSAGEDNMEVLQAVLDTNFWLGTHVVCVTLGYASTGLAGLLGIVYVICGTIFKVAVGTDPVVSRNNPPPLPGTMAEGFSISLKVISKMIYGIVCFGIFFSFVGTVLGGIWADQSWGRFWGWDPKENGAVLVVLWNALILHARWGGLVKDRGVAVLSITGIIVVAWSYFGTNLMGVGLHSYGFMEHGVTYLLSFMGVILCFIALGLLPLSWWRSFNGKVVGTSRGFEVVPRK
jgi:ABC-type transport system involved in cytochrome c biogenesis permease subunit